MSERYRDRPFPPDNNSGRGSYNNTVQDEGDPLAELARLIGQTDPFSNFSRDRQKAPAQREPRVPPAPEPVHHQSYEQDEPQSYDRYEDQDRYADRDPYGREDVPPQHRHASYDEELPPPPSWMRHPEPTEPAPEPYFQQEPHYGYDQGADTQGYADQAPQRYADDDGQGGEYDARLQGFSRNSNYKLGYEQPVFGQNDVHGDPAFEQEYGYQDEHGYQAETHDRQSYPADTRYDDLLYGEQPQQTEYYGYDQNYQYQDDAGQYAEEAAPKRKELARVAIVAVLAVVGTAAAYGYRSFTGAHHSGEPPVIKADASPNKIVPNNQNANGKQIYDRVGDASGTEKMVPREEQPVDVGGASQNGGPRVVFPPLTQNASPPAPNSVAPDTRPTGPGVANGTLNGDAPRAIKTLTIRPDQSDSSMAPATTATAAATPAPAPAAPTPWPTAAQRPAQQAAPAAGAPLALTPQAVAPRSRVASLNPTAPAPSASGSYVQVSSQRTEADAMKSYRVLQEKYSGVLGSRQASVRRVDLGDKGVYYRALVGPFASTEEATQFCVNLQSAGGKCIVQRN